NNPPTTHPREPRHPRGGVPEHGDEPPEEDGFAAVAAHDRLGARQHTVGILVEPPPTAEQRATAPTADDPVAEVVTDDRSHGCNADHLRNRVVALRRQHRERDQRRLAWYREPE